MASSSEAMRLLELFELQEQEGPCLDAFRTGERVRHENLDAGSGRWPSFSAAALQAGFASASALPLRLRDVTIGALNLLSVTRAPMDEADVIVARAFADLAALSIVQHRASAEAQRLNEQLSGALTSRVVIEQAKGVICERADVDLAQAFSRLRADAAATTSASPMSPGPQSTAPSIRWPGPPCNTGSVFPRRWRVRPAEWRAAVVIEHDHRAGVQARVRARARTRPPRRAPRSLSAGTLPPRRAR